MNYIGGKYKLLPQLLPLFPKEIDTFVDMFCGGGNVGINVEANKLLLNDNLLYIVDLYRQFKSMTTTEVVNYVEQRINDFELSLTNTNGYLALRNAYNQDRNPLDLFVLTSLNLRDRIFAFLVPVSVECCLALNMLHIQIDFELAFLLID